MQKPHPICEADGTCLCSYLEDGLFTLMYNASLIHLQRFWSSLPTMLKLSKVTLRACESFAVVIYGVQGVLQGMQHNKNLLMAPKVQDAIQKKVGLHLQITSVTEWSVMIHW